MKHTHNENIKIFYTPFSIHVSGVIGTKDIFTEVNKY